MAAAGNLFQKLQSVENSIRDLTNRVNTIANSLAVLESESERNHNATSQKLSLAVRDISVLKQTVSELSTLMDFGVEQMAPAQHTAQAQAKPQNIAPRVPVAVSEVEAEPELEQELEPQPTLQFQYDADGAILALTRSGVDVKGMAEQRGYQCIGTVSRGMDLFLKLKLA